MVYSLSSHQEKFNRKSSKVVDFNFQDATSKYHKTYNFNNFEKNKME